MGKSQDSEPAFKYHGNSTDRWRGLPNGTQANLVIFCRVVIGHPPFCILLGPLILF